MLVGTKYGTSNSKTREETGKKRNRETIIDNTDHRNTEDISSFTNKFLKLRARPTKHRVVGFVGLSVCHPSAFVQEQEVKEVKQKTSRVYRIRYETIHTVIHHTSHRHTSYSHTSHITVPKSTDNGFLPISREPLPPESTLVISPFADVGWVPSKPNFQLR